MRSMSQQRSIYPIPHTNGGKTRIVFYSMRMGENFRRWLVSFVAGHKSFRRVARIAS